MPDATSPSPRRRFLARVTGSLAMLGAARLVRPGGLAALEAAAGPPTEDWDDSWLTRLTAGHKQIFDCPGHLSGGPMFYVNNFIRGLEASGIAANDIQAVIGLHGTAVIVGMTDALWTKYKLGETYKVNDPKTKAPSLRNPWLTADDPAAASAAWTVTALQGRGVGFIVCNNVLRGLAGALAREYGGTTDTVRDELVAGLAPGVLPVPAMVAAFHRAQLKGCSYVYAGLASPPS